MGEVHKRQELPDSLEYANDERTALLAGDQLSRVDAAWLKAWDVVRNRKECGAKIGTTTIRVRQKGPQVSMQ
jgi:hypothetical protein